MNSQQLLLAPVAAQPMAPVAASTAASENSTPSHTRKRGSATQAATYAYRCKLKFVTCSACHALYTHYRWQQVMETIAIPWL